MNANDVRKPTQKGFQLLIDLIESPNTSTSEGFDARVAHALANRGLLSRRSDGHKWHFEVTDLGRDYYEGIEGR